MYVLGSEEQERLLSNLSIVETTDGGWTKKLVDPNTGEKWILYFPHSSSHGGGQRYLRREPVPEDLAKWVGQCIGSDRHDDTVGAATDLSERYETWGIILDYLEPNLTILSREQVNLFIKTLGILDPQNRYPIVGKHFTEIAADAAYFNELSERASSLLNKK